MTSPEINVELAGHEFKAKRLTDVQLMHLNRHARILSSDNVAWDAKSESMNRMFTIIHNAVVDPEQLQFLIGLEEDGKVELKDLVAFAAKSMEEQPEEEQPVAVVRRRGRPRKSVS